MHEEPRPWWEEDEKTDKDLLNLEDLTQDEFNNMVGAGSMPPKSDEDDKREPDVWDSETF